MRKLVLIASLVMFSASYSLAQTPTETKEPAKATAPEMSTPDPKPAKPAKKRAAKRETDEQKARRIGAKYGVTW